ncbi:hypothetical protein ACJRO7_001717 [Eucalyptus globulus]|uniref:Uncharacterized protein n=1 Tax=Eucalyptus globulus TaxID=34317 RepID=A0ABD3LXI8_EUCGL
MKIPVKWEEGRRRKEIIRKDVDHLDLMEVLTQSAMALEEFIWLTLLNRITFNLFVEALHEKGLRDDTTCIVIYILPQDKPMASLPPPKKPGKGVFKSMFCKKSSESSSQIDQEYIEPDVVEELYEDGSTMLSERLDTKYPLCNMFRLFMCAVCQVELKPGEDISIHAGSSNPGKER